MAEAVACDGIEAWKNRNQWTLFRRRPRSQLHRRAVIGSREFTVEATADGDGQVHLSLTGRTEEVSLATHLHGVVRQEDLPALARALGPELKAIAAWRQEPRQSYAELVSKARQSHGNAFTPWTGEDERILVFGFRDGKSVTELSVVLGRSPSAVHSRVVQLGEVEPVRAESS